MLANGPQMRPHKEIPSPEALAESTMKALKHFGTHHYLLPGTLDVLFTLMPNRAGHGRRRSRSTAKVSIVDPSEADIAEYS